MGQVTEAASHLSQMKREAHSKVLIGRLAMLEADWCWLNAKLDTYPEGRDRDDLFAPARNKIMSSAKDLEWSAIRWKDTQAQGMGQP